MDILRVLGRAACAERAAAEVYEALAGRLERDGAVHELFRELAVAERSHARNLAEWRVTLEREGAERRPIPVGFDVPLARLEETLASAATRVEMTSDADQAFAIALEIESSELDGIYRVLVRSRQLASRRSPAAGEGDPLSPHHERLLAVVRARSRDEVVLRRAALLEAEESQ